MKLFAIILAMTLAIPAVLPAAGLGHQKPYHRVKHHKIRHKTH
jgi:hypothetical protein